MADATLAAARCSAHPLHPLGEAVKNDLEAARRGSAMCDTQTPGQGYEPKAYDFEDAGHRIDGLLHLAHWIERARGLTEEIEAATDRDKNLKAHFQARGIAYGDCLWVEEEQNGLLQLLMIAAREVRAMTAAGMALNGIPNDTHGVGHE